MNSTTNKANHEPFPPVLYPNSPPTLLLILKHLLISSNSVSIYALSKLCSRRMYWCECLDLGGDSLSIAILIHFKSLKLIEILIQSELPLLNLNTLNKRRIPSFYTKILRSKYNAVPQIKSAEHLLNTIKILFEI